MEGNFKTIAEATGGGPDEAAFWHAQIREAAKVEEDWRKAAEKLVERYRDDKRETGTCLNIFWSNVQLLKPAVFSATPAPDVRRRNISEDQQTRAAGRQVSEMLERGLSYAIDAWAFDPPMKSVRDDSLIVGRGLSREDYQVEMIRRRDIQHIPAVEETATLSPDGMSLVPVPGTPEQFLLDGQPVQPEVDKKGPYLDQKAEERIESRYVFWADFRMSSSRQWSDVWWVAFRHPMTRDELKDEFGEDGAKVKLTIGAGSNPTGDENKGPKDPEHAFDRAEVWEVWNKRKRERVWVATGHRSVIRKDPDPLNLAEFFPMPCPLYAVETTDTMVPVPEFTLYQDQADELDEVQERIRSLTKTLKAVNLVDGDFTEVVSIGSARDGDNIPIQRPSQAAEDLGSSIWTWPIQNVIQVILGLVQRSDQLRQFIYEVTGISDLMRGSTAERETAKAQGLKGQYGQVRMTPRSQPMHEYVRDTLRLKAEIMAEMFDPSTLERISGSPVTPEMLTLMRDEKLRNTNIEVATESTIRPDVVAEKEEALEYVGSVTKFLQAAGPIAMQTPALVPLLMEMLKAATKPFKWGRQLEETMDATADALSQMAQMAVQQQMMAPPMPAPNGEAPAPAPGQMVQ